MEFLGLAGNASSSRGFVAAKGLPVLARVKDFVFLGHVGGAQKYVEETGGTREC
jgi:hypothetical protein